MDTISSISSGKLYFIAFKEGTRTYEYMKEHYQLLSSDESSLEGILDDGTIILMECAQKHISKEVIEVYEIPEKYQGNPKEFETDFWDGYVDLKLVWS